MAEARDPIALPFAAIGISGQADAYDLWAHKVWIDQQRLQGAGAKRRGTHA